MSADYSQFELRLSAAMSDDQELIDMFNRDVDVHTATAAQVYGREPEDVTKQMRRTAKAVNFGHSLRHESARAERGHGHDVRAG